MADIRERIVLTGGSGSFGSALQAIEPSFKYEAPSSEEFNITNIDSCRAFLRGKSIDVIIHAAARTNWEKCQEDQQDAFQVNLIGTLNMVRLAQEHNARLVFCSSDGVFSGQFRKGAYTESDIPQNPPSMYGLTKLLAEHFICHAAADALIVRLGWFFGPNPQKDTKFVGAILRQIGMGKTIIKAVADKVGSPTYTLDAAEKILQLIDERVTGIRHIANTGPASRFEVAKEIAQLWNSNVHIDPVSSDTFPSIVRRPDFAVLSSEYPDCRLPHWKNALHRYHRAYPQAEQFVTQTKV